MPFTASKTFLVQQTICLSIKIVYQSWNDLDRTATVAPEELVNLVLSIVGAMD